MDRCDWHRAFYAFGTIDPEACRGEGMLFTAKNGGLYCLQHIIEFDRWFEEESRG